MNDPIMRFSSLQFPTLQQLTFFLLAGAAATILISIAASQILLVGAIVGMIWLYLRGEARSFWRTPILWPVLALFIWTILAALASPDIIAGLKIIKKFNWFLVLFLVPVMARGTGRIKRIYQGIFLAAAIAAAQGLVQFAANPHRDLLHRITGFMSHWMTYSGLLMLTAVGLTAYVACIGWRRSWWIIPTGLLIAAPLFLSQTRSAWMGTVAGVLLVLALRRPRAIPCLLILVLAVFFLSPAKFQQRLRMGWDITDPTTLGRLELVGTSMRLIRDHPWFGVGPNSVKQEALHYRGSREYPDWLYQHMHNNFLQIAAERGIPGLLVWMWFMLRLARDAFKLFRRTRVSPGTDAAGDSAREALLACTAALGAWLALLVSGFFEYNFGDSEVLMLFLFMTSAPYAFLPQPDAAPKEVLP